MRRCLVICATCLCGFAFDACNGGKVTLDDASSAVPSCTGGADQDKDGYGKGCPAGDDCDDSDASVHPGAKELCDGKDNNCDGRLDDGALNSCGTCDPGCGQVGGSGAFPIDPKQDPRLKDVEGLGLDDKGDLILKSQAKQLNYMWIANTYDVLGAAGGCTYAISPGYNPALDARCRGTVSKVDTVAMKEVARYYTTVCKAGVAGCVDVNGKPIVRDFPHAPSRTAVDINFDVWVANRAFGGQPSATKIANDPADCVDRNKNGKIDTSKDQNGDGKIEIDCNADGKADGFATVCGGGLAGKPPEFLGDDDECILFTTNYSEPDTYGRSICLDAGKSVVGASDAWVGTWNRPGNNRFYRIDGNTGAIKATVNLPPGHHSYGCTADGHNVIWSTFGGGTVAYFKSIEPYSVGPLLSSPRQSRVSNPAAWHYGIAVNADGHIWLGGSHSCNILRYKPDRTAGFDNLSKGTWTVIHVPCPSGGGTDPYTTTRGVAPDLRGKVWMALTSGYIVRVDQSLPDGEHDLSSSKDIWELNAKGSIGVGIDFHGNVWGIGHSNSIASRLDVDAQGNVTSTTTKDVAVGKNPYTYSDFTGFGLMSFVRPQGRYVYQLGPCPNGQPAVWKKVVWRATTPPGTSISVRARSGDGEASMGNWTPAFSTSPAVLQPQLTPNPSRLIDVEVTLKTGSTTTPVLHDFGVAYDCTQAS